MNIKFTALASLKKEQEKNILFLLPKYILNVKKQTKNCTVEVRQKISREA